MIRSSSSVMSLDSIRFKTFFFSSMYAFRLSEMFEANCLLNALKHPSLRFLFELFTSGIRYFGVRCFFYICFIYMRKQIELNKLECSTLTLAVPVWWFLSKKRGSNRHRSPTHSNRWKLLKNWTNWQVTKSFQCLSIISKLRVTLPPLYFRTAFVADLRDLPVLGFHSLSSFASSNSSLNELFSFMNDGLETFIPEINTLTL